MLWRTIAKLVVAVGLTACTLGVLIADYECQYLNCGSGSRRCFAGCEACVYCDGTDPVWMCAIVQYSFCTSYENYPCGNTYWGLCASIPGQFSGNCGRGTYYGPGCSVMHCHHD
jgi:hypothetical protein